MNNTQFKLLLAHQRAKKNAFHPAKQVTSRRQSKSARNGTGQKFLKGGGIWSEVGLEKLFIERKGI